MALVSVLRERAEAVPDDVKRAMIFARPDVDLMSAWDEAQVLAHMVHHPKIAKPVFRFFVALAYRENDPIGFVWADHHKGWGPISMQQQEVVKAWEWAVPHRDSSELDADVWKLFSSDKTFCVKMSVGWVFVCLKDKRSEWRPRVAAMIHHRPSKYRDEGEQGKYLPRLLYVYEKIWGEPLPWVLR